MFRRCHHAFNQQWCKHIGAKSATVSSEWCKINTGVNSVSERCREIIMMAITNFFVSFDLPSVRGVSCSGIGRPCCILVHSEFIFLLSVLLFSTHEDWFPLLLLEQDGIRGGDWIDYWKQPKERYVQTEKRMRCSPVESGFSGQTGNYQGVWQYNCTAATVDIRRRKIASARPISSAAALRIHWCVKRQSSCVNSRLAVHNRKLRLARCGASISINRIRSRKSMHN